MKYSKKVIEAGMKLKGITYPRIAGLSGFSENFVHRVVAGDRANRDGSIERTIFYLVGEETLEKLESDFAPSESVAVSPEVTGSAAVNND